MPAAVARIAIASSAANEYRRPRVHRWSGTEPSTSRNSDRSNGARTSARQRSNASETADTGDTEAVGTGVSPVNDEVWKLHRHRDTCAYPAPKRRVTRTITPAHSIARQQRRSPGDTPNLPAKQLFPRNRSRHSRNNQ